LLFSSYFFHIFNKKVRNIPPNTCYNKEKTNDNHVLQERMVFMEFTEGLRKVFLAGVGAVASTAENAKELIDDLVEKGELTVAQGRMLNEELKHTAKEKVKEHISVTVTRNYTDAMNSVDQMTEEELNALKEKIAQTEEARKEQPEDPDITSDERTPEESE